VALRQRCGELAAAVARERPDWTITHLPSGGLHLWIQLPPGTDDADIARAARRRGVAVSAGGRYFATEAPAAHLRLGFAATADRAELVEAVHRLSQV
jgi:DNA-binding transcriptional MocR family regulator